MVLFCLEMLLEFDFLGGRRFFLSGSPALLDSTLPVATLICLGIVSQSSLFCAELPLAILEILIGEYMFGISPHVLIIYFLYQQIDQQQLYSQFDLRNKMEGPHQILLNSLNPTSMQKGHIEDLSAIIQKKSYEESQMTYEESKPAPNIRCLVNNRENYQCMICQRLRQVCPYTKLTQCLHEGRQKGVYKSDYFMEKSNISTLAGQRQRTLSQQQVYKNAEQSRSRQYKQILNAPPRLTEARPPVIVPQQTHTHITVTSPSEVIYYPVIHNRYVVSPTVDKSTGVTGTPKRMGKSRRVEYDDQVILTPTQIKEMLYSYKQ